MLAQLQPRHGLSFQGSDKKKEKICSRQMPDDTLARFINDDSQWGDYVPAAPERSECAASIRSANDVDNVTDEGTIQAEDRDHVDDRPLVDDLSPRVDTASAARQAARRTLRVVPSAASVATTVLDTSEDDVELPVKRMRSQELASDSMQTASVEFVDLSPL